MFIGHVHYNNIMAQQHAEYYNVFKDFLKDIQPRRILEIGTAHGGFILSIKDIISDLGLNNTVIKSYDIIERHTYNIIRNSGVEINVVNIFNESYTELIDNDVINFINQDGTTLVLCDGGNKINEFNILSKYIKPGDFIMAHDYIDTQENFENNFYDKIWNCCEIQEKDIEAVCKSEGLLPFNKNIFDKVVWVCKRKSNNEI